MNSFDKDNMQDSTNTSRNLSVKHLFERGIEYIQQGRYNEGMPLLKIASEHLTPAQEHIAHLLDLLMKEYTRYSQLQHKMQEVSDHFIEIQEEIKSKNTTFNALCISLLNETEHTSISQGGIHGAQKLSLVEEDKGHSLYAICLAPFEIRYCGTPIPLCPNRNAQAILRYLVAQTDHSTTADTLMALFWPEDPEKVALRKLNVTMSILRRCLQDGSGLQDKYILYKNSIYQLNPALHVHSDVDEFMLLYNTGRKLKGENAVSYYEIANSLYIRPFLMEDLYADWSFAFREQLRQIHLEMCHTLAEHYLRQCSYENAVRCANEIIEENRCDEAAYRLLMRIYALQGRRNDALRQYQLCKQVLLEDLNLRPMPETTTLCQAIMRGEMHF
ncbi:AfsR/SARP family transcriptional regulator [Dictyobacter arantiisoli]|uniref:Bacterial transcriptional activator domain-containing protein n=1 Tax=Dictyobacter arantiisoli TaxID=2014874 RepID=A0A5A5T9Y2_9CHLR|nr:BTAD domain-containing putative transcriptional regulator [Dictyobacter arantiisoli]GCF07956.1 hypothetical protein KDI_15200 [Dictyobacter arantiisoli]